MERVDIDAGQTKTIDSFRAHPISGTITYPTKLEQ